MQQYNNECTTSEGDVKTLIRIAEGRSTPLALLRILAKHWDAEVRIAVADNRNSDTALLQTLALDEHPDVRFALAENHNISLSILEFLISDSNPYVAGRARRTLVRVQGSELHREKFKTLPNKWADTG